MSTETIVRCDFCGKVKGEVNHWWSLWLQDRTRLIISPYVEMSAAKDACGMQCATQGLARFMDHGTLEER